jgi:hypothetical protein
MKNFLDRFILGIPRLYLKQFPYAWIAFIALWTWPPNLSFVFLLIILIGMAMLQWRHYAWISHMRSEYAPNDGKFYVDRPPIPLRYAAQNILILTLLAGILAFFINKQIGLTALQVFLIVIGFSMTYRDSRFFGAPTTYIITASGIGIHFAPGHLDYRLFLKFGEISRVERCGYQKDKGWDCFARIQDKHDGLLLIPKNPKGLTKRIEKLFIVPGNIDKFLEQMPYGFTHPS